VPAFAHVVSVKTILDGEDGNLNIRRYADTSPSPEPNDVRAHLHGGVPLAEIEALRAHAGAQGFNVKSPFIDRGNRYAGFADTVTARSDLRALLEGDPGIAAKAAAFDAAFAEWWVGASASIVELPETKTLMQLWANLMATFIPALLPLGSLDRFRLQGAVAGWWEAIRYELRTVAEKGFAGLIDGWVETLRSAVEEEDDDEAAAKTKRAGIDELIVHPFARHAMADYIGELEDAQAEVDRWKAEKDAFERGEGVDGADDWLDFGEDEEPNLAKALEDRLRDLKAEIGEDLKRRTTLTKTTGTGKAAKGSIDWLRRQGVDVRALGAELAQIERRLAPVLEKIAEIDKLLAPYRAIKDRLAAARVTLRALKKGFVERLEAARASLDDGACRELVLIIHREALHDRLAVARMREVAAVAAGLERLWDKYRVSLTEIEAARTAATDRLSGFLKELGYVA
jgi:type I restriction enzyme M protein